MLQFLVSTEETFCKSDDDTRPCIQKLVHSAGKVVNSMKMPRCWEWTIQDVSHWLEEDVKLPQYKDCLEINFINGRRLCLLEADKLLKMGIHDFSHIKEITEAIRSLFNMEKEKFGRSISLPLKNPKTLYLEYRVPTGPIRESTTPVDFYKKISLLEDHKDCRQLKSKIDNCKFPITRFGGVQRKSVYTRIEFPRNIQNVQKKFIDFIFQ